METTVSADEQRHRWLSASWHRRLFIGRKHTLRNEHDRWRKIAELQHLSRAARGRLEWIIFWEKNRRDVALTARHFGISRKTFDHWLPRFEKDFLRGLEERSRTPHRKRTRQYTALQYEKVVSLRLSAIHFLTAVPIIQQAQFTTMGPMSPSTANRTMKGLSTRSVTDFW